MIEKWIANTSDDHSIGISPTTSKILSRCCIHNFIINEGHYLVDDYFTYNKSNKGCECEINSLQCFYRTTSI